MSLKQIASAVTQVSVGVAASLAIMVGVERVTQPTLYEQLAPYFAPCPQEDSVDCEWDATTRGEPGGTSFVAVGTFNDAGGAIITTFYANGDVVSFYDGDM